MHYSSQYHSERSINQSNKKSIMTTAEFERETKALIDSLKSICNDYRFMNPEDS